MDVKALISEFGGGDKASSKLPKTGGLDVDALVNEFGGGYDVKRENNVTVIKPQKLGDPGFTAEMQPQGTSENVGSQRGIGPILEGIKNLPANIAKSVSENAEAGKQLVGEGLGDIGRNAPASGVGKIGLGALQYVTSPITGAAKETIEEPIAQLTGNRKAGEIAGAVATSGLPVTKAAGATVRNLPRNRAFQTLVETIEPKNIPTIINELKSNPRLSLMDVSPAARQMAQKLVVTEGKHLNHLSNVVEDRFKSAKGVVGDIYDSSLGTPVNVVDRLAQFKKAARDVGQQQINPAVAASKPVDITPVIQHIDDIIKPGTTGKLNLENGLVDTATKDQLKEIRGYFTDGKSNRTSPQELHEIQSAFRSTAEKLMKSTDGPSRLLGGQLMAVRNKIVDAIDSASGGKYKPALKAYRDEGQIQDAFDVGNNIISGSKKLENRPEFFSQWKKGATKEEIEAAKEGARIAIDTQIRTAKNAARSGTDIVMPDFSASKLRDLFGKTEADKMIKLLQDEQKIAQTNSDLFRNSQTAMRQTADSRIALPEKKQGLAGMVGPAIAEGMNVASMAYAGGGVPGLGAAVYGGSKAVGAAKHKIATKLAQERNFQIAKMVSASEGPDRDELIKALSAIAYPAVKPSLVNRASTALSKVIGP